MADKEVGGLTAATTLDGSELLHVVQGSNSRKTTVSAIVGTAHSQAWSGVTGTPTTVSGYGITDAQAKNVNLTAIAALSPTSKSVIIGNDSAWTAESGSTFRASVGLAIGSDVQAYDADLTALGGLAKADGNVIIGDGTTWTVESGATLRTSFGLSIGSDVQAYNATLASLSGLTLTDGDLLYSTGASALANLAKGADGQVLRLSGGVPSWANVTGTGDMAAAIYDPNSVGGDAFSQDNMVDGTTNKNFTAAEKTKLAGAGDMQSATYDPQGIGADAFDRANHTGEIPLGATNGLLKFPLAGGTANALTLTPTVPLTAYVDDTVLTFEAKLDNSGAATLDVSGVGAKAIRKIVAGADDALVAGDIRVGGRYFLNYDAAANAGAGAWILVRGGTMRIVRQFFTASGTYTPTPGMVAAIIEAVGGGGAGGGAGGGGAKCLSGGGGGGGGYSKSFVTAADIGASKAVTIGAAGIGGNFTTGGDGGITSVGTLCIASGGIGGAVNDGGANFGPGGAGAAIGTGNLIFQGEYGESGMTAPSASFAIFTGAAGAASFYGARSRQVSVSNATLANGFPGIQFGSGGGGGTVMASATTVAGGNGSSGIVIITEYCI